MSLRQIWYYRDLIFWLYLLHWYQTELNKTYINIFSEIMLVFSSCIESISRLWAYFPLGILWIIEFISWDIIGTFRSLLSITIYLGHFFRNEFFWFCFTSGSSEWKFWSRRFCWIFDLSKSRINFSIRELNKILVSINFLLLFLWWLIVLVVHNLFVNKIKLNFL